LETFPQNEVINMKRNKMEFPLDVACAYFGISREDMLLILDGPFGANESNQPLGLSFGKPLSVND
jgi:cytochrome P450